MSVGLPALIVLLPLLAAVAAGLSPSAPLAGWCAVGGSVLALALTAALPWLPEPGIGFLADPLAVHMAVLTAFIATTGAAFARSDARHALTLYPALLAALLLALLADNLVLLWAGMAAAVLLLAAALRLDGDAAAAWRLFLSGSAALAMALLGTLLISLATLPVLGADSIRWTQLADAAPHAQAWLMSLSFVCLLLGYGTLAGLVPLHGAFSAVGEGPGPVTGVLGGLLPGVALVALLRARTLLAANPEAMPPGPALLALGLLSLGLTAFTLRRQRDPRRFLAVAGTGQVGVVAFAFGVGTGAAIFAGVLHLTLFALLRAALAMAFALAMRLKGGAALGGLLPRHRALGLTLAVGLVALAGLPPFGLFTSLFLIVTETVRQAPVLAIPLGLGLAGSAVALGGRVVALCRHVPTPDAGPAPPPAALLPAWLPVAVALVLGLAMPGDAVEWLAKIAEAFR